MHMKISKQLFINNLERLFVVFVLFFSTSPLTLFLGFDPDDPGLGEPVSQAIWLVVYMIMVIFIVFHWKRFLKYLSRDIIIPILIILAVASFFWSAAPLITLRRSIALALTVAFGIYLAARYPFKEQLKLLYWAFCLIIFLSLATIILFPSYGIHQTGMTAGAWRGIYHQKSNLGIVMFPGTLISLFGLKMFKKYPLLRLLIFISALTLLIMSQSVTSLLITLAVILGLVLLKVFQTRLSFKLLMLYAWIFLLVVFIAGVLLITHLPEIISFLGKDPTFFGRIVLWQKLLEVLARHPLLGYGYNGFWLGWNGPSAEIWSQFYWLPRHAHNGYLDLALDLGLIGFSIFAIHYLTRLVFSFHWLRKHREYNYLFPLAFYLGLLVTNITQSTIMTQNSLYWILYIAFSYSITTLVVAPAARTSINIVTKPNPSLQD